MGAKDSDAAEMVDTRPIAMPANLVRCPMELPVPANIPVISVNHRRSMTAPLSLVGRLLQLVARRRQRRSPFHAGEGLARTTSPAAYDRWRLESLRQQIMDHFDPVALAGRDVLDFGCGTGGLSRLLAAEFRCRSVIGIDASAPAIERARSAAGKITSDNAACPGYLWAKDDRCIDLPNASADCICCFDVLEHVPHPLDTLAEWHRVLRPGGEVWIWWSPWRGPYGHHLESLIPLPWVHLFLPPRTLFRVRFSRFTLLHTA